MNKMDADIERLKELNDRLTKLLADDERGLTTWRGFMADVIAEMYGIVDGGGSQREIPLGIVGNGMTRL